MQMFLMKKNLYFDKNNLIILTSKFKYNNMNEPFEINDQHLMDKLQ